MGFSKPTTLGVIACPGGEKFANEIISHLKMIYQRRFEKKALFISKQYDIPREEMIRRLNLSDDMNSHRVSPVGNADDYRMPSFKVPTKYTRFANGEVKTEILHSVKGMDIFIVQDVENRNLMKFSGSEEPVQLSINDHLMSLFVTIDAAKQAGARRVSLILPTYPYSRQHKRKGREGLTASSLGHIFENMGIDRIVTLDIHSKEIEHAFTNLTLENLHASYQILRTLRPHMDLNTEDLTIVSPDIGAIERNKFYADSMKKPLALIYKERDYSRASRNAGESNITNSRLLGDVDGKAVFMNDDLLGTGGTFIKAMKLLRESGAKEFVGSISLPLFSGNAVEYFDKAYEDGLFSYMVGTNAVTLPKEILEREWYLSADVSNLFARTISRVHHNRSVSPLLDNSKMIQRLLKR
ncbi:MAG: ribose-phosphate diphosphokinase [Spirochaetales bacterium]|nr:ribose-phosphate diphosphokinase [Spirochaetales bacterium]